MPATTLVAFGEAMTFELSDRFDILAIRIVCYIVWTSAIDLEHTKDFWARFVFVFPLRSTDLILRVKENAEAVMNTDN